MITNLPTNPAATAPKVPWLVYVVLCTGWVEVVDVWAVEVTEALTEAASVLDGMGVEWTKAHAEAQR